MDTKPTYKHDCECCRFLGSYKGHDLYEHRRSPQTAIARFGPYGDYHSGKGLSHPDVLHEANLRAGFLDKEHERLTSAYVDENETEILDRYETTSRPEKCLVASKLYFESLILVTDVEDVSRFLQDSLDVALEDSPIKDILMGQVEQNTLCAFEATEVTQQDIEAYRGQPWEWLIHDKGISWPVSLLGCPGYAEKMTSLLEDYLSKRVPGRCNTRTEGEGL